jgi:poly-gamma-glutamate synthesis protein (capsule biosynthesis protein)
MPSIVAVGDLMLGDTAAAPGFGFASRLGARRLAEVFHDVAPLLDGADVVFGNLEVILSLEGYVPDRLASRHMRGWPRFALELKDLGFTVLNVANNHANQHGTGAFLETCRLVESAGIGVCGIRGTAPWCSKPLVLHAGGERVGFLGYCLHPRRYFPDQTPPFAEGSLGEIVSDISRFRPQVDSLCVSLHWGEEFVPQASEDEAAWGEAMVAAGADLRSGRLVALSLGNFASDLVWDDLMSEGVVLRCGVERGTVTHVELHRTRVNGRYQIRIDPRESRGLLPLPPLPKEEYHRQARRLDGVMRRRRLLHLTRSLVRADWRLLRQWVTGVVKGRLRGA